MRLTKIYTKAGDQGETHFKDNHIAKDDIAIHLIGTLDELNCFIGLTLAFISAQPLIHETLTRIQHELFDLGGELHAPKYPVMTSSHVMALEQTLDHFNDQLPPLKEFVLPRGTTAAATCHVARAVCRRAERELVTYRRDQPDTNTECLRYLNRLSDLLFVFARVLARSADKNEPLWRE
jgi:cob(I)alamin adenosyltransferase